MPDSEKKATKKATKKKAPKKAAKKAVAKKAPAKRAVRAKPPRGKEVETVPLGDSAAEALGETPEMTLAEKLGVKLDEFAAAGRQAGIPTLNGPAEVRLIFEIPDAFTPIDAVDDVMSQILRYGIDGSGVIFLVTDLITEEVHMVKNGAMFRVDPPR